MDKIFQLKENIFSINKQIEKIKKKYFQTKTQIYFKIMASFAIIFFMIMGRSLIFHSNSSFEESTLNKPIQFDSGEVTVVNKEYSSKSSSYRMDVYFNTNIDVVNQGSPRLTGEVIEKGKKDSRQKVKVEQVSDRYFVLIASNVVSDFSALRFDLNYQSAKNSQEVPLKLYASEDKSEKSNTNFSKLSSNELKASSLKNDIRLEKLVIKDTETKIKTIQSIIKESKTKVRNLTDSKEYQVGEELTKTEDSISTVQNSIEGKKAEIKKNQEKIEESEKKITLIEEKIQSIEKE